MPPAYTSNLDALMDAIRRKVLGFGFDNAASRGSGTVGDHAAAVAAEGIHDRSIVSYGPDGQWPDNADSTIKRKGFNWPNVESGSMVSEEQIAGDVQSTNDECRMRYGKDDENRKKAKYAHEGQGPTKVVRKFFALDNDIRRDIGVAMREEMADRLKQS